MQRLFRWLSERRLWFQRGSLILLGIGILAVLVGGYALHWSWTGFNRTLWDWMQLLIIPAVLAIVGFLFNRAEHRSEQEAASNRQQWSNRWPSNEL
jgi:hypothetical protein